MSHELHHFSMGMWVFFLAYVSSVVGSFVGLSCVRQAARETTGRGRTKWLIMASLAIGGVGIWLMHFLGMMGFSVPGSIVRYDIGLTVLSAVLAIGATLFGLWLVTAPSTPTRPGLRTTPLLVGGVVMGLAVSSMHYSGMAAIRIQGIVHTEPLFIVVSVIIGIVASITALWLSSRAESVAARVMSAMILALAVVALHYTGMAGVSGTADATVPVPEGLTALSLMFPGFVFGIVVLAVPSVMLLLTPTAEDDYLEPVFV